MRGMVEGRLEGYWGIGPRRSLPNFMIDPTSSLVPELIQNVRIEKSRVQSCLITRINNNNHGKNRYSE